MSLNLPECNYEYDSDSNAVSSDSGDSDNDDETESLIKEDDGNHEDENGARIARDQIDDRGALTLSKADEIGRSERRAETDMGSENEEAAGEGAIRL